MDVNAIIDEKMALVMNLRQKWIDEGFPQGLRDELKKELKSSPAELEIHKKLVESLKYEVDQGDVPLVAERGPQMLPIRNRCTDIPGHVTCFKEHNGLIHGGVVHAPDYLLRCKAYSFLHIRPTTGNSQTHTVVVAGVCDQKSPSGQVINTWSIAERLKEYYSSTSISLPTTCFKWNRTTYTSVGHYMPENTRPGESPDSGSPRRSYYDPPDNPSRLYQQAPSYENAVENALYTKRPICSEGFPICTPYIKVFHPDPNVKETIVFLMGAYREVWYNLGGSAKHERKAQWYCKTFR